MAKAMVTTVSPKARATPSRPIPTWGKAAASTALPQPPSTSQKVPMNSAASFLVKGMDDSAVSVLVGATAQNRAEQKITESFGVRNLRAAAPFNDIHCKMDVNR